MPVSSYSKMCLSGMVDRVRKHGMILPYISLVRTGGQTGPSLFYGTELYLQYNYKNGNKQIEITEGGNEDQMSPEVSLKLGWDELESLERLEGLGGWERLGKTGMVLGMTRKVYPAGFPYKVSSRTLLICQVARRIA